jgi:RNA polymerase sigma factor (TIGR02999 family)
VEDLSDRDITALLVNWGEGNEQALRALIPRVYDDLRRIARQQLRHERPGHTLQSGALVHEAYLRLTGQRSNNKWHNREQFFALAASLMRRILVDYARRTKAEKRGAGAVKLSLDDIHEIPARQDLDLLALDAALQRLEEIDPQQSRMVELRFFSGLSIDETAQVLGLSPATVSREWSVARAYLFREINRRADGTTAS